MANQQTLGELKSSIEGLQTLVGQHGTKLDKIRLIVYSGVAVLVLLASIGAFVINKIWGSLIALLAASGAG